MNRLAPRKIFALTVLTAVTLSSLQAARARADEAAPELYRRSYAAEKKGDLPSALAAVDELAARAPTDYTAVLRRAWLLYLNSRLGDSVSTYESAIALEPEAVEPRLGVLLPLMALRRWQDAERRAVEVLHRAPNDLTALGRLAYIHYVEARYPEAEADYRKALAAYPSDVEMRAGLAWTLLKSNRGKEARAQFDRVLAVAPDYASASEGRAALAARN